MKTETQTGPDQITLDRERIERLWTPFAQPWFADGSGLVSD